MPRYSTRIDRQHVPITLWSSTQPLLERILENFIEERRDQHGPHGTATIDVDGIHLNAISDGLRRYDMALWERCPTCDHPEPNERDTIASTTGAGYTRCPDDWHEPQPDDEPPEEFQGASREGWYAGLSDPSGCSA